MENVNLTSQENALQQINEALDLIYKTLNSQKPVTLDSLTQADSPPVGWSRLTQREKQILYLMTEKLSTNQIASILHKSPKTITNQKTTIINKLELNGVYCLLEFVIRHHVWICNRPDYTN